MRGSTPVAETMSPLEFSRVMNRFYEVATGVLVRADAFIDKMVGDEVMAVFLPALTGHNHAAAALTAAQGLLEAATEAATIEVPIGVGVHSGVAFFGTITAAEGAFSDLAVLGDVPNVAARLASLAQPGEALISEVAYAAAQLDVGPTEQRVLNLKGKSEPLPVRVLGG